MIVGCCCLSFRNYFLAEGGNSHNTLKITLMKRFIATSIFASLFCVVLLAGNDGLTRIDTLFQNAIQYSNTYVREKVYLHFDNTSYYLGEKLWFKAYVTSGQRELISLSKVLYVELLNQYGQLVERQVLQLENGTANGQFELSDTMLPGFYEVRAYTRWMRNFGDSNYYSRVFPFYAKSAEGTYNRELYQFHMSSDWDMQTRPETPQQKKITIDFFPEGGHLVRNIPNVVAFRIATKEEPYPMASMTICSSEGDSIGECFTVHDGMGRFVYCPGEKPGYLQVGYDHKNYRFDLPEAEPEGYCLSIGAQKNDSVIVRLQRSSSLSPDTLGLAFASGGEICRSLPVVFESEIVAYKLPLSGLPGGVSQAVLFDQQGNVLCERMFFVNRPEAYLSIGVQTDKKIYSPGDRVNMDLNIKAQGDKGVATGFSLSVRDALSSDLNFMVDNARTNLLLSSELSGYIHHPEYYFLRGGKVRSVELDLLMLVHGWRKYSWKELLTRSKKMEHPAEMTPLLEGRLKSLLTRSVQSNKMISLMVKEDSVASAVTIHTDSLGHFSIPLEGFAGRRRAVFVANNDKGDKRRKFCYFLLDRNIAPQLRAYHNQEMALDWDSLSNMNLQELTKITKEDMERMYGKTLLLDEVEVKERTRKRSTLIREQDIRAYFEVENMVEEDWDKGIEYGSLNDFLRKKNYLSSPFTKGMDTREATNSSQGLHRESIYNPNTVFVIDGVLSTEYHNRQLIDNILDGLEGIKTLMYCEGTLSDPNFKNLLKGNMEMRLDLIKADGSMQTVSEKLGDRSYYGIYYITTTGEFDYKDKKNRAAYGTRITYINGYNTPEEFYSPDYSAQALPADKDHRRTLYWNPSLHTDENGHCNVSFYNASNYTYLNVNAETVTSHGEVGSVNMLTK